MQYLSSRRQCSVEDIARLQVEGVETDELAFQPAARFGPIMDEVHDRLVERCAPDGHFPTMMQESKPCLRCIFCATNSICSAMQSPCCW